MSVTRNMPVFLGLIAVFGLAVVFAGADWRVPAANTGYAPEQPLAYSHRLHAGELGIDCTYCHFGARTSRHAGIPPAELCMNCHKTVSAAFDLVYQERELALAEEREPTRIVSESIARLYAAVGLDEDLEPLPEGPQPLDWVSVHNLPDFVAFDHRPHVARGLACQTCHGPVQAMERMRQQEDLSMGWCVNCHRSQSVDPAAGLTELQDGLPQGEHVSTDCAICHY